MGLAQVQIKMSSLFYSDNLQIEANYNKYVLNTFPKEILKSKTEISMNKLQSLVKPTILNKLINKKIWKKFLAPQENSYTKW